MMPIFATLITKNGHITQILQIKRGFSISCVRRKALKNWVRPSIDEIGVPTESWKQVFDKNQKRFNAQLLAGMAATSISIAVFFSSVNLNSTPDFLKDVNFVTITPPKPSLLTTENIQVKSPSEIVHIAEDSIKVVEEVVEVVKETLDVVKEAIETADEVVKDIKKIEDDTKEILEDGKEIVKEGKQLIHDVEEAFEEGKEIAQEVKKEFDEIVNKRDDN